MGSLGLVDYIIIAFVILAVFAAVYKMRRAKKKGAICASCPYADNPNCSCSTKK